MNIIFGDSVKLLSSEHIVLELDTVLIRPMNLPVKTWCVVESLSTNDLRHLEEKKQQHADLLVQYRSRDWTATKTLINSLLGSWNHELDSFYHVLLDRINQLEINPPDSNWDGSIEKFASDT